MIYVYINHLNCRFYLEQINSWLSRFTTKQMETFTVARELLLTALSDPRDFLIKPPAINMTTS